MRGSLGVGVIMFLRRMMLLLLCNVRVQMINYHEYIIISLN